MLRRLTFFSAILCLGLACGLLPACNDENAETSDLFFLERANSFLPDDSGRTGLTAEAADLNADGNLDLIVGYAEGVEVWSRRGTERFRVALDVRLPQNQGNPVAAEEIRIVDIDNDNDLDLILASGRSGLRVWLQRGLGNFEDETQIRLPQSLDLDSASSLEVTDVNGDGSPDLFVSGPSGTRFLVNRQNGTFRDSSQQLLPQQIAQQTDVRDAEFADLDGDGGLELLIEVDGQLELLRQRGTEVFQFAPRPRPEGAAMKLSRLALADVDADADVDLIAASDDPDPSVGRNRLLLNEGELGFLERSSTLLPRDDRPTRDVVTADLDLDGDEDLIFATAEAQGVLIYLNEGDGRFLDRTESRIPEIGPAQRVRALDIDFDNDLDLLVMRPQARTALLESLLDPGPLPTATVTPTPDPNAPATPSPTPGATATPTP